MNLPWHLEAHVNSPGATMKNNLGNVVAIFTDYKNAEYVTDLLKKNEDLEKMVEALEDAKASLIKKVDEQSSLV